MSTEYEHKTFDSDLGHKAKVVREDIDNDNTSHANRALRAAGNAIQGESGYEYIGSACFHIYMRETFLAGPTPFDFATQIVEDKKVSSKIWNAAMQNLDKRLNQKFTGKKQVKRSGF